MTKFLLIRHAEHELGTGVLAGRTPDVRLSAKGHEQADALAKRLAGTGIDALYSSPILRCGETAARVAAGRALEVRTEARITEFDFGGWQGERIDALDPQDHWRRFNAYRSGTRAPGGELYLEAQLRVVRAILDLGERHRDETVALVAHADVIRAALLHFLGIPIDLFLRLEILPASVSTLVLEPYGPRVLGINHPVG